MRYKLADGTVRQFDQEFTIGDVTYPGPGRLTQAERDGFGITEVVEQPLPDTRYGLASEDPANPGAWILTPFSADQLKDRLLQYAADVRYLIENRPVTVTIGGQPVKLSPARGDDRAALHITFSAIASGLRVDTDTFKFSDGIARAVTNAEMAAAIKGALTAVQAAYNTEASVANSIRAGTIVTYEAVNAAFGL